MKVLVVAAHPDDEVLGCGATMARHAQEGDDVHVVILGEGATSRSPQATSGEVAALAAAAQAAGDVLGASSVTVHDLPDNRFDTVPLLDVAKLVQEHVDAVSPGIVYTHHLGDLNVDHEVTARAVLTATRPQPDHPVRELYAFEISSSTEWAFGALGARWSPDHFVDVTGTIEKKMEGLSCYSMEMRAFPHPRSDDAVRAGAMRWGSTVGVDAAEAFQVIRSIR